MYNMMWQRIITLTYSLTNHYIRTGISQKLLFFSVRNIIYTNLTVSHYELNSYVDEICLLSFTGKRLKIEQYNKEIMAAWLNSVPCYIFPGNDTLPLSKWP